MSTPKEVSTATLCRRYRRGAMTGSSSGYSLGGANVNVQGGFYGNALQAASAYGHNQVVERLLTGGAGVNAQGGYYGNALQAASARAHAQVVERLLAGGADVNAHGGIYGNALKAASAKGHNRVVERLLAVGGRLGRSGDSFYGSRGSLRQKINLM